MFQENDILIVDDNEFNLFTVKGILENFGLNCKTANNGRIAIQKVKEKESLASSPSQKGFQIIFMDCRMPLMDGWEVTYFWKNKILIGFRNIKEKNEQK